ncbi:hypothetical protein [Streptomyces noursei]|uniref:hypothetical protein n=1 Tax=Streptomyces noursei TaxID=1971 RepID=UPI0023B77FCA|nr:hypothetical protein [Streptomyces noursei]
MPVVRRVRRIRRRRAAAVLRDRRRENRTHRQKTQRVTVKGFLAVLDMDAADIDRYSSWAGRHIAAAYRAAHHGYNTPCTTRTRTKPCSGHPKGRWIKVYAYRLTDPALIAGCATYKRTAPLLAAHFALAT